MRTKNLLLLLLIAFTFHGCKKECAPGTNTMIGSWDIQKIQGLNGNNNYTGLDFIAGKLNFKENGILEFLPVTQELYTGTWQLNEIKYDDNCDTDADGHETCDHLTRLTLNIAAERLFVAGLQKKSAYFESVKFTGSENLYAQLFINGFATHDYSFVRSK